ncbi:MAG: XisI protein [Aphanizomenon sp.]
MDKIIKYRELIKKILTEYDQLVHQSPDYDSETHDHYLWLTVDWQEDKRLKSTHIHVRIKNNKIYIEEEWTQEGITTELLREGVPKEDIVSAFHDPETRKFTEFAVA